MPTKQASSPAAPLCAGRRIIVAGPPKRGMALPPRGWLRSFIRRSCLESFERGGYRRFLGNEYQLVNAYIWFGKCMGRGRKSFGRSKACHARRAFVPRGAARPLVIARHFKIAAPRVAARDGDRAFPVGRADRHPCLGVERRDRHVEIAAG